MTYFRSVVDSPEQVQSWLADTCRWNTTAAGATEFRIEIDEPPGGPVARRIGADRSQCCRRPATCSFSRVPRVRRIAPHRHRSVGAAVPPDRCRIRRCALDSGPDRHRCSGALLRHRRQRSPRRPRTPDLRRQRGSDLHDPRPLGPANCSRGVHAVGPDYSGAVSMHCVCRRMVIGPVTVADGTAGSGQPTLRQPKGPDPLCGNRCAGPPGRRWQRKRRSLTELSRMVAFGLQWCAIAVALLGSSRPISGWTMWRFSGSWSHTSRSLRRHSRGRIWSIGRRSSPVDGAGWAPDQARVDRLEFYVGCVVRRACVQSPAQGLAADQTHRPSSRRYGASWGPAGRSSRRSSPRRGRVAGTGRGTKRTPNESARPPVITSGTSAAQDRTEMSDTEPMTSEPAECST